MATRLQFLVQLPNSLSMQLFIDNRRTGQFTSINVGDFSKVSTLISMLPVGVQELYLVTVKDGLGLKGTDGYILKGEGFLNYVPIQNGDVIRIVDSKKIIEKRVTVGSRRIVEKKVIVEQRATVLSYFRTPFDEFKIFVKADRQSIPLTVKRETSLENLEQQLQEKDVFLQGRIHFHGNELKSRVPIRAYGITRGSTLSVEKVEKAKKGIEAVQKENKAPKNNRKFLTAFS